MKKNLLVIAVSLLTSLSFGQCFERLEKAFLERGSQAIVDNVYKEVIISYLQPDGSSFCHEGKVRVKYGLIESVFTLYEDGTYLYMEDKFYNSKKQPPAIVNGISEEIRNASTGEKFRIVFIKQLKPKRKAAKKAFIPDDL
tara:strand:- start:13560 stop:13982 length:423 start_codon:yes stop_codon:yes gene_type:complete